jgi:hypothetical protein
MTRRAHFRFRLARAVFWAGLLLIAAATPALPVNWEGHDDWLHGDTLYKSFTDDLPPPLMQPIPRCSEMEKALETNRYEQIPLPGLNCVEGEDDRVD